MNRNIIALSLLILGLPFLAACAAVPEAERALFVQEVDCAQAGQQIATLEAARPNDFRRARILASSLSPAGFALGVATNDFGDRERVLSGEYEAEINARIALIRDTCNLPAQEG